MTRAELKALAKQQLGGGIFKNSWLLAVLAFVIYSAIMGAASYTGIGTILLMGPLSYGLAYLFLKQARDNQQMSIGDLFKGFSNDFGGTFMIGIMTTLFTVLWSMLFVIPGIVKSYAYSMAYYIKLDHPEYDWRQCINESKSMMKGYKMTLFVQDLSFIGWMIVGGLVFGVGTLWVTPYQMATRAQFYNALVGWQAQPEEIPEAAVEEDPYAQLFTEA